MHNIHVLPQSQQPSSCLLIQPGDCPLNGHSTRDRPSIALHLENLILVLKA